MENNIFERLHTSLMLEWGAAGNVIAYNLSTGNFHSGSYFAEFRLCHSGRSVSRFPPAIQSI